MLLEPRKYTFSLLLLCSLVLVYFSGRMMVAALWARQVNTFLVSWEQGGVEPEPRVWQVAFRAANKAIALYPGSNADYYDRLGRVWEWQLFQHPADDEAVLASQRSALNAYRESVATRPLWPYTWVSLAYIKMRLGQIDDEFIVALHKSVGLGPWRIKSNKGVAEMGLITWFDLDDQTRALVVQSIRRTVDFSQSDARWLEKRALESNMTPIFCGVIARDTKEKRKVCAA